MRFVCKLLCFVLAASLSACSRDVGSGMVEGTVTAGDCQLDNSIYSLQPNFFAADSSFDALDIRIQRGSEFEHKSDGVSITVTEASRMKATLGQPIELSADPLARVRMNFYLHETCELARQTLPVNFVASSGTVTFTAVYAPSIDDDDLQIAGRFDDVVFDAGGLRPEARQATLSGNFDFLFTRGRPLQLFP